MVCLRYVVVYTLNSYDEDRETRILLQAWLHEMHLNGSMRHYDYENDVHTQKPRVVENHANGASCNIFGCRSNLLMSKRKANESPQLSAKLASCRNPGRTRVDFVVFTVFTNSNLRQTDPVLGCQRLWLECTCSVMQDVHIHIRIRIHIHIHMYIYMIIIIIIIIRIIIIIIVVVVVTIIIVIIIIITYLYIYMCVTCMIYIILYYNI